MTLRVFSGLFSLVSAALWQGCHGRGVAVAFPPRRRRPPPARCGAGGHLPRGPSDDRRCRTAASCLLLLDGLDLDFEADLPGEQPAAGLQGRVPVEAPVLAVDLGEGGETGTDATPGVGAGAEELEVEGDWAGNVLEGQIAGKFPDALICPAQPGGAEGNLRVLLDIEEVGGLEVPVAARLVGVDAVHVDLDRDGGLLGLLGDRRGAGDAVEAAADLRGQVPGDEFEAGVGGVSGPGASLWDDLTVDHPGSTGDHRGLAHPELLSERVRE